MKSMKQWQWRWSCCPGNSISSAMPGKKKKCSKVYHNRSSWFKVYCNQRVDLGDCPNCFNELHLKTAHLSFSYDESLPFSNLRKSEIEEEEQRWKHFVFSFRPVPIISQKKTTSQISLWQVFSSFKHFWYKLPFVHLVHLYFRSLNMLLPSLMLLLFPFQYLRYGQPISVMLMFRKVIKN